MYYFKYTQSLMTLSLEDVQQKLFHMSKTLFSIGAYDEVVGRVNEAYNLRQKQRTLNHACILL